MPDPPYILGIGVRVAETSAVAFGRYLRELRERRGLSLARVCELSRGSPEAMDKGTLSRLERGQQTPSIFRLGPLSRIYEISADALIERMELDRDVDRTGGPDTGGKSYEELHEAGASAVIHANRKWEAYACFRDARPLAPPEKTIPAWVNVITANRALGKDALALHELRELAGRDELTPLHRAIVHERMSGCCRCLGEMARAEEHADRAIAQARLLDDPRTLAYALCTRAGAAVDQEQWPAASRLLLEALATYRAAAARRSQLLPSPSFEAQTTLMLAECSIQLGSLARARRLIVSAQHLAQQHELPMSLAYSELLLGWIDDAAGRPVRALDRWRRAAALAARIDDQRLMFAAEVEIFRQAVTAGEANRARACRRRLERLAPWIPKHIPAYQRYKRLTEDSRKGDDRVHQRDVASFAARGRAGRGAGLRADARRQPQPARSPDPESD